MIDWTQTTGFEWDHGNSRKNETKHNVSRSESEQIFFNQPILILQDPKHSQSESRYHALGTTDLGRLLHITFTLRHSGALIRIISARNMHRKERIAYEQVKKDA